MRTSYSRVGALLATSLLLIRTVPSVDANETGRVADSKGAIREVFLPSPKGHVRAFTKDVRFLSKTARGETEARDALLVISPQSGTVWVGPLKSHCLVVDDSILGFFTLHGGLLVCRMSTNRIDLTGQTNGVGAIEARLGNYLRNLDAQDIIVGSRDREISLAQVVGYGALMDLDRAEGARAATIMSVESDGELIIISLKSGVGKIIRLALDRNFNPVSAHVDDKTVFEKGNMPPPTVEEEFKRRESK